MDNYLVTIRGILNEHPELSSRVKSSIRTETTLVRCELINSKEFSDHTNVTLRTLGTGNCGGIIIHKYIMNGKVVNPHYVAFRTLAEAKEHIAAWQKRSS